MQTPFDATGLGLTRAQGAVLAGIAQQGTSTAVYLSGQLRLSAEAVSRAVTALVDMGLIDRGVGRPRPLSLSAQLEDGLARLRAGLVDQQKQQRVAFDRASNAVTTARDAADHGPRPTTGLVPSQPVPDSLYTDVIGRRERWDEVLTRASPVFGGRSWLVAAKQLGISARLLLIGPPPRDSVVRGVAQLGHQLRATSRDLPTLMIADGKRVRVEINAGNARRQGWSEDPRHVALAMAAFDSAWAEAQEVHPTRPPRRM